MTMDAEETKKQIKNYLSRHRRAWASRKKEDILSTFLALLFSPFYSDTCLGLDKTLSMIAGMYEKADKKKDEKYVRAVLEDMLSPTLAKDLRDVIVEYLKTSGISDSLHWFLYDLIVRIYFYDQRSELMSWAEEALKWRDKGSRRFIVNAPMGLGKTYAIYTALATGRYSAVVFSPDKTLRDNMVKRINEIARRELASVVEGIDKSNCDAFENVIESWRNFKNNKPAACKKCGKKWDGCKTWAQKLAGGESKVLVTTHAQYEAFYESPQYLTHWYDPSIEDWRLRDFFVIDESIIDKHLFESPSVGLDQFIQFHALINKYWESRNAEFRDGINKIHAAISLRGKSVFIPYIKKDYKLSNSEDGKLNQLIKRAYAQENLKPPPKNIKGLLTQAIRAGCAYDSNSKMIYFSVAGDDGYLLKETKPMHVFFDASEVPEFLMNKLFPEYGTEKIPRKTFDIPPLGQLTLYHTNNEDLPRSRCKNFEKRLKIYCKRIVRKHGVRARCFVATLGQDQDAVAYKGYENMVEEIFKKERMRVFRKKKGDEDEYDQQSALQEFDQERPEPNYGYVVLRHYGDIRGTNIAKDCDVGLVLGKFKVPDAVEIAWAIPFLSADVVAKAQEKGYVEIEAIRPPEFHGKIKTYRYTEEYNIVNVIAEWKRDSENEQAIGRTRFLFHPVVFYAITKDDMAGYAMFRKHADKMRCQLDGFGIDLFAGHGNDMAYFSKWAMDEILWVQKGAPQYRFTAKDVGEEANRIAALYDAAGPQERAVRDHIPEYLDEHYRKAWSREWIGNTWVYIIRN